MKPRPTHASSLRRLPTGGVLGACLAGWAVLAAGCQSVTGPPPAPEHINHYVESRKAFAKVHRVAFVQPAEDVTYPGMARSMTHALVKCLQGRRLFHIQVLDRHDPVCQDLDLDRPRRYTTEEIAHMRRVLKADAVLWGRIEHMEFYPRAQMAMYLALVDLRTGEMLWGVDDTWDARDRSLTCRVEAYNASRKARGDAPVELELVKMSPREFQKFVAHEIAWTLEPRKPNEANRLPQKRTVYLYKFLEE